MEITNPEFYVGDKWSWLEDLSDYSAALYTLKIYLRKGSAAATTITATAEETTKHRCTLAAASTASLTSGIYHYQATVTEIADATNVITIDSGEVEIKASLATEDPRSWEEQQYDTYKDVYETMLSEGTYTASITINGKQITIERGTVLEQLLYWERRAKADDPNSPNASTKTLIKFT
jgi:hypothetical protein